MNSIVWASCWLAPPNNVLDALVELNTQLKAKGILLVIFGDGALRSHYPGLVVIDTPFYIAEIGRRYASHSSPIPAAASTVSIAELAAIDRAWGLQLPDLEAELLIMRANAFWEKAFAVMQPSVILSWGATAPVARMLFNIARRFQRPAFVIERGLLEDTISYSIVGQGMLSNFNTNLSLIEPNPADPSIVEAWEAIEKYYSANESRHYPEINREADEKIAGHFEKDRRPRILYLGSHDIGSGASLDPTTLGDLQATWVTSSVAGLEALCEALEEIGFGGSLWFKPHGASYFEKATDKHTFPIVNMANIDVYSIIDHADICVTLTSSTQFIALLKGKPVITLGNGQFSGRGIFYEAPSYSRLVEAVRSALDEDGWTDRLKRGRALLAAGYRETHIGLTPSTPTRYHLDDFCNFISRFGLHTPVNLPSADERVQSFLIFLSLASDTISRFQRETPAQENNNDERERQADRAEDTRWKSSIRSELQLLKQDSEALRSQLGLHAETILSAISAIQDASANNDRKSSTLESLRNENLDLIKQLDKKNADETSYQARINRLKQQIDAIKARQRADRSALRRSIAKFVQLSLAERSLLPILKSGRRREIERNLVLSKIFDANWYISTQLGQGSASSPAQDYLDRGLEQGVPPNKRLSDL